MFKARGFHRILRGSPLGLPPKRNSALEKIGLLRVQGLGFRVQGVGFRF